VLLGSFRGLPEHLAAPGGGDLYVERVPGSGGTLVLTHGWCLSEAVWHDQKRTLGGAPWGVVTWDLPGHGHSSRIEPERISLESCVDALGAVVDSTEGPLILVGHSLGGAITLAYLARRTASARRVRGAVLVSTPMAHLARAVAGRWPGAAIEVHALATAMTAMVGSRSVNALFAAEVGEPSTAALSYRVVRVGFGRAPRPEHVRFVRDLIADVPPSVRVATFRAMGHYDLTTALGTIGVPTLVMLGARDRLVDPSETRALAAALPRGRLVEFPDAGHALFLERAEAFQAEVAAFAASRLRAPRRSNGRASGTAPTRRAGGTRTTARGGVAG
jgi:pimeloyl-ACP methyl ester carboxylesterase